MLIEKTVKEKENSQLEITALYDSSSFEEEYEKHLEKYKKEISLPGFRRGKAPLSMIESKFGDVIWKESLFEAAETLFEELIKDVKEEEKPLPFSRAALSNEDEVFEKKRGDNITLVFTYDVMPKITLPVYKGLEITAPSIKVDDKDIQRKIDEYRENNAIIEDKDGAIENGDLVTLDIGHVSATGEKEEGLHSHDHVFTVGQEEDEFSLNTHLPGMKKGEEKIIKSEEENHPDHVIKIKEIKKRTLPEVDNEFAEDIKEEWKTVDDMKKGIKEELEKLARNIEEREEGNALLSLLLKEFTPPLPSSMVNFQLESAWRTFLRQNGMNEENALSFLKMLGTTKEEFVNNWRVGAEVELRRDLLLDNIKKAEEIEIDEEEFEKRCQEELKNVSEEEKDFHKDNIRDEMKFAAVIPFLLKNNKIKKEKAVSLTAYFENKKKKESENE